MSGLLSRIGEGVLIIGPDFRVRAYNDAYRAIFSLEPGDICDGMDAIALFDRLVKSGLMPPDPRAAQDTFPGRMKAWANAKGLFERRNLPDGRTLDIFREVMPNGEMVAIVIDVSERLRDSEELARQRRYMSSILENTTDGVTLVNARGDFIAYNRRFLDLYRIDPAQAWWGISYEDLGRQFGDLMWLPEEEREREIALRKRFATDSSQISTHRELRDGRTISIIKTLLPEGGCVMTLRDITEDLVRERELREARDAAERSSQHKSQFVARMSHEMRTPLNGILGVAALLRRTALDDEQRRLVDVVSVSGELLLRLIDDVLDLSRIEANLLNLVEQPFRIDALIEECRAMLDLSAREKGLVVTCEPVAPLPMLRGDPHRLKQVLLNLVMNAIKFTEAGGVTLSCAGTVTGGQAQLVITVTDTGVGIPDAQQHLIFEQFYQVDQSVTRRHGGAGLGLAIAQTLIDAMGGRIEISSELGKGSVFRITLDLPLADEPVTPCAPPAVSG